MTIGEGADKLAHALLRPVNPAAIIILGVYTIVWGLWIFSPFWSVFGTAALYSVLNAFPTIIPPEYFWGGIAIITGSFTTYGAIVRHYKPLARGALFAGWHWGMIAAFYFLGDWMNTGGITALTFALYAAFIWLNLRVNRRFVVEKDLFTD